MTQADKDLLLKDLCARLPYGIKADKYTIRIDGEFVPLTNIEIVTAKDILAQNEYPGYTIKPYLFPLSSMTEEQKEELDNMFNQEDGICEKIKTNNFEFSFYHKSIFDFLNKHHLDWRGLIPMGLANDATNKNIY